MRLTLGAIELEYDFLPCNAPALSYPKPLCPRETVSSTYIRLLQSDLFSRTLNTKRCCFRFSLAGSWKISSYHTDFHVLRVPTRGVGSCKSHANTGQVKRRALGAFGYARGTIRINFFLCNGMVFTLWELQPSANQNASP